MNFVSYAAIGCDCSTNGAKVLVFGAMRFIVGDYWYGSDIIDYRGRPDDVAAVIAGEGQHYDSYAVYAITARQYWYDIRSVTYSNELLSLYAAIELKRNMDAVGNLWMSYNRSLDAVGGPHKTLGSAIRCGRCPEYCH